MSVILPSVKGAVYTQTFLKVVASRDQVPEMGNTVCLQDAVFIEVLLADKAVFGRQEVVAVDEAGPAEGAAAETSFEGDPHHVGHLVDGAHQVTIHHLKVPLTANPTLGLVANKTLDMGEKLLVLRRPTGEPFQPEQLVLESRAVFSSLAIPTRLALSLNPLS